MNRYGKKKIEAFLDMTPLIDVVFLLLIFFMVATTFDDLSGFKLQLPTSTSKEEKLNEDLTIIVSKTKEISIVLTDMDGKKNIIKIDKDSLKNELEKQLPNFDTITLAADGKIDYQFIIDIMTISKEAGIPNINIKTKK